MPDPNVPPFDTLSLVPATRRPGAGAAERRHHAYAVNGRRLDRFFPHLDLVSPFGWLDARFERSFARMLLLEEPSPLASSRVPLYVCPECADLGCGAVTVRVVASDDAFAWLELGHENDYEDGLLATYADGYEFHFEKTAYLSVFGPLARS